MGNPGREADDGTLVSRARRGDAAAFQTLVRRHYRAAYAVALARLGNAMDAEDACQDAFLRALERLEDCRNPGRFAAWLLTIVRNRAHNLGDARRLRTGVPLEAAERGCGSEGAVRAPPIRDAERGELRALLETALGDLSELRREVVLLHDLEGYTHPEIAEALEISAGMSRQHLMHARRDLRASLEARSAEEYLDAR